MQLTDFFDKVFIINLPFNEDRKERLGNHLDAFNLVSWEKVEWVRAISGELCSPPQWFEGGAGAWGCLQSHIRIAQDATMDGIESYCVLEDDVLFHSNSATLLRRLMSSVPSDWGQIYLGGQHLESPCPLDGNPFILKCANVNRTHAYALKRRAFAQFQQHVLNAADYMGKACWHIDHQLGLAHGRWEWPVYAPAWWLAGQEEGSSSICGQRTRRIWWHSQIYRNSIPFLYLDDVLSGEEMERLGQIAHFGNNLKPQTKEDVGLDACVESDEKMLEWLAMIGREALDYGLVPGIQHPAISRERVLRHWKAGLIEIGEFQQLAKGEYPYVGLMSGSSDPSVNFMNDPLA